MNIPEWNNRHPFSQLHPHLPKITSPPVIFSYWCTGRSPSEFNLESRRDVEQVGTLPSSIRVHNALHNKKFMSSSTLRSTELEDAEIFVDSLQAQCFLNPALKIDKKALEIFVPPQCHHGCYETTILSAIVETFDGYLHTESRKAFTAPPPRYRPVSLLVKSLRK